MNGIQNTDHKEEQNNQRQNQSNKLQKLLSYKQIVQICRKHADSYPNTQTLILDIQKQFNKQFIVKNLQTGIALVNLERSIGAGCFGTMVQGYLLQKAGSIVKLAIKQCNLTESQYKKQGFIIEYRRQLQICQILKNSRPCQNIVKFYDSFQCEQKLFLMFEYVDSLNLMDLISCNSLTQVQIYDLVLQLVKAIYFLHYQVKIDDQKIKNQMMNSIQTIRDQRKYFTQFRQPASQSKKNLGVLHRDLKPQNILIYQQKKLFKLKVCDFGVSKVSNVEQKYAFTVCGTKLYSSPQQSVGGYSGKADIWSLGIIVFQMLSHTFREYLKNKVPESKGNGQTYFKKIKQLAKQYNYQQLKYKTIWNKLLENCLKDAQNQRWNIKQVKSFLQESQNRVRNNQSDMNQEFNPNELDKCTKQLNVIYLQILKHERSYKSQNPVCRKSIRYFAILGLYWKRFIIKSKKIQAAIPYGDSKFSPQNKSLDKIKTWYENLSKKMNQFITYFQRSNVKSQMAFLQSQLEKQKINPEYHARFFNQSLVDRIANQDLMKEKTSQFSIEMPFFQAAKCVS